MLGISPLRIIILLIPPGIGSGGDIADKNVWV